MKVAIVSAHHIAPALIDMSTMIDFASADVNKILGATIETLCLTLTSVNVFATKCASHSTNLIKVHVSVCAIKHVRMATSWDLDANVCLSLAGMQ